jgi:ATP-dependent Clp protease ATP-binding subunit ClpX
VKSSSDAILRCSFCGKEQAQIKKLIAGPGVFICDECVALCTGVVEEEKRQESKPLPKIPKPWEIKKFLDDYVIGQEQAKRILSVAAYNHYKRIHALTTRGREDTEIQKSNILIIGSSGTGKTLLGQTLARCLKVPFTIVDATAYTEAGYVGEDIENMVSALLQVADYDVEKCERGIIFIDEIDKKSMKGDSPSLTRDVSGEGVQQALLKLIEGTTVNIPPKGGRKHSSQDFIKVRTHNILFICGGAFEGLSEVIAHRKERISIGIGSDNYRVDRKQGGRLLADVEPSDLGKYGMIPELIGRLPVIATLADLDRDALSLILTQPKNAIIKQYQELFRLHNVELVFEQSAIDAIVERAIQRWTGVRGLRSILEESMLDLMYEVPSEKNLEKVVINSEVILNKGASVKTYRRSEREVAG